MRKNIVFVMSILCWLNIFAKEIADPFDSPEIIKHNVTFWKKIYTEVSLEEGLLHDQQFPMVIFGTVTTGKTSGRTRRNIIRSYKQEIVELIESTDLTDSSSWNDRQKWLIGLYDTYADRNEISGAIDRIRFQQGQKERFLEGIYRSGAYLDTIRAILAEYDIPLRLAYLPHVESSFNPYAYSKVGAAGMWQFMRGTGKNYGLKIGYTIDERRDPILATRSAAKLLSHNYRELKAWPLAITAYNHGLYGMKRAVKATGSRDIANIIQRHQSRTFKFASKNFYSCFLAAIEIADNPQDYFDEVRYAPRLTVTDITLSYYMKPSVLANYTGVSTNVLEQLNPMIRPVVFRADKLIPAQTVIHLPPTVTAQDMATRLALLPDSLKITAPPRPKYYRVQRGDNLYGIARRYGVSATPLRKSNCLSVG
ncbi:MAG: transglycosylase SLT domain-containing protein [Chitinivibrionales bacterium]|nr:transglycosylase SLT domain-containing protein [Chitinivibrionales bacterium]